METKIDYHVHKSRQFILILSQAKPIQTFSFCPLKFDFRIFVHLWLCLPSGTFFSKFSLKYCTDMKPNLFRLDVCILLYLGRCQNFLRTGYVFHASIMFLVLTHFWFILKVNRFPLAFATTITCITAPMFIHDDQFLGKVKLSLYWPWKPLGLREVETLTFSEGAKVVSPTRRPLFTRRKIPGTHFC
jgi:hypothetical protein